MSDPNELLREQAEEQVKRLIKLCDEKGKRIAALETNALLDAETVTELVRQKTALEADHADDVDRNIRLSEDLVIEQAIVEEQGEKLKALEAERDKMTEEAMQDFQQVTALEAEVTKGRDYFKAEVERLTMKSALDDVDRESFKAEVDRIKPLVDYARIIRDGKKSWTVGGLHDAVDAALGTKGAE